MSSKELAILDMVLVQRREWDVTEPDRSPIRSWNDVTGVEIHYTGAPGPKSLAFVDKQQWLLNIERYHEQTKGWSDIFYNLFVFADGEVWMGRNPLVQSQKSLFNWLTVHVPGTTGMELTAIQKIKIARMTDIVGGNLRGHGERSATSCPGASAMSFIGSYRDGSFRASLSGMTRGEFADKMAGSVQGMVDAGLTTQQVSDYRADDFITREESAAFFVRYAGETVTSLHDALVKCVDMGFYTSIGNGGDIFQKSWFDAVFARVAHYVAAEAAAKAAAEAHRLEAERIAAEAAAESAAESARLKAEQAAAEEAARLAAEEEARLAAEKATSAVTEVEETEIPESADVECCAPVEDEEVGGLLRKILNWVFSIFKQHNRSS